MPLNFFALDLSKECFWSVSFIIFLIGSSDLVDYFNSMKKNVKKPRRFALLMVLVAGILIPHLEGCSSDKAEKHKTMNFTIDIRILINLFSGILWKI